jgi:hypothetical protein
MEYFGTVYFIGHGDHGPVKVGYTADYDVMPRLRALQTGNPVELKVLGKVSAPPVVERAVQRFLSAHSVQGEWFERGAALALLTRLELRESHYHESEFLTQLRYLHIHEADGSYPEAGEESLQLLVARDLLHDVLDDLSTVNTATPLPFRTWLLTQVDRDDPTGDLAKDAARDPKFPAIGNLATYLEYVQGVGGRSAVTRSVIEAWIECDVAAIGLPFPGEGSTAKDRA